MAKVLFRRGGELYGCLLPMRILLGEEVVAVIAAAPGECQVEVAPGTLTARFQLEFATSLPFEFSVGSGETVGLRAVLPQAPLLQMIVGRKRFGYFILER